MFIPAERLAKKQALHFVLVTILPVAVVALWFSIYRSIHAADILLATGMWILTGGLGISLGFHRYFTHGSFTAHPVLQTMMAAAGSMAGQGPVTYWVSIHRCHHQHSDVDGDPHSPVPSLHNPSWYDRSRAFLHGHMGWVVRHDVPSPLRFARDVAKNPVVSFFDQSYWLWVITGIILPGMVGFGIDRSVHGFFRGCVFGGFLRLLIGNQIIWAINSVCHAKGRAAFMTKDFSKNNLLLVLPSFGEGWHNNHHAFPWSARFGLQFWEIDLGWWALDFFKRIGLATDLKQPSAAQIAESQQKSRPVPHEQSCIEE
jgi:stearoyl-CoA desaturase (delta-9 desaturase)